MVILRPIKPWLFTKKKGSKSPSTSTLQIRLNLNFSSSRKMCWAWWSIKMMKRFERRKAENENVSNIHWNPKWLKLLFSYKLIETWFNLGRFSFLKTLKPPQWFLFFVLSWWIKKSFSSSNCLFRWISHKTGGTNWPQHGISQFLFRTVYDSSSLDA